jgi:hypothetical protein
LRVGGKRAREALQTMLQPLEPNAAM